MSPQDMATIEVPDKLTMVSYLSQFYEYFRKDVAAANITKSETFLLFWYTATMLENAIYFVP